MTDEENRAIAGCLRQAAYIALHFGNVSGSREKELLLLELIDAAQTALALLRGENHATADAES